MNMYIVPTSPSPGQVFVGGYTVTNAIHTVYMSQFQSGSSMSLRVGCMVRDGCRRGSGCTIGGDVLLDGSVLSGIDVGRR